MDRLRSPIRMPLEGIEGIVLLKLAVLTWPLSRRLLTNLGARPTELARTWPGDDLIERIDACATRAVTCRSPAKAVWPWLLQFGLRRGGFHSYELLERLGGIDVRNVERIIPELQTLEVGQEIKLHPKAPGLWVALIEPGRSLCYRTWKDERDLRARDPDLLASFSMYVVAESDDTCRLVVRTCKQVLRRRSFGARMIATLLEDPLDLVMEQRMLRTIRRLSEGTFS